MRAGILLGLIVFLPNIYASPIPSSETNETSPIPTPLAEYKARFMKWIVPKKAYSILLETGFVNGKEAKVGNVTAQVFNSIPYAKPPTGERRFENPEPMDKWTGAKDTTQFRECWHMSDSTIPALNISEDCLYLKAVIPAAHTGLAGISKRYPTVFWIHGGGFTYGSKENYELENIVKHFTSKEITFIAPNYRLGVFGFLSQLNDNVTGNYGLEDLILALKFVRENEDVFHVDVNQITIAGEGSGAALASLLAASPRAKGLFSSLILSSGTALAKDSVGSEPTSVISKGLWSQCCFQEVNSTQEPNIDDMKECLKKVSLTCIDQVFMWLVGSSKGKQNVKNYKGILELGSASLTPVVDSYRGNDSIIPEDPTSLVSKNAHVPILLAGVPNEYFGVQEYIKKVIKENKLDSKNIERVTKELLFQFLSYTKQREESIHEAYSLPEEKNIDIVKNLTLIMKDMFTSAQYAEALSYAKSGMDVYYIRNIITKSATEETTKGMDTSLIFGNLESPELEQKAEGAEKWITAYVDILTEFIKTRKVNNLLPFSANQTIAYNVSNNGTEKFTYKPDNYDLWRSIMEF